MYRQVAGRVLHLFALYPSRDDDFWMRALLPSQLHPPLGVYQRYMPDVPQPFLEINHLFRRLKKYNRMTDGTTTGLGFDKKYWLMW